MFRYPVRIDDYPWCGPVWDIREVRTALAFIFELFDGAGVPYILGATPRYCSYDALDFLTRHIGLGRVVMHGWDHNHWMPMDKITSTWDSGGEFSGKSAREINDEYHRGLRVFQPLVEAGVFWREHYIAPFNTYTQEALYALRANGVCYLHTCDKEYDAYGYAALDHCGVTPVVACYQRGFDYAGNVADMLERGEEPEIVALHWVYDMKYSTWKEGYKRLAGLLKGRFEDAGN